MNDVVLPLPEMLAGAGLAGLGVWAMSRPEAPLVWRELRLPGDLETEQVEALLARVAAGSGPVVFVVDAQAQSVRFFVGAAKGQLGGLKAALAGIAPEVVLDETTDTLSDDKSTLGARAWWPGRWSLLRTGSPALAVAGLLGSLSAVSGNERVQLVVRLNPAGRIAAPEGGAVGELRKKLGGPLLKTEIVLAIKAMPEARAALLRQGVIESLRSLNGPVSRLRVRRLGGERADKARAQASRAAVWSRWSFSSSRTVLSPSELVGILGLPIGAPPIQGISYGTTPLLMPASNLPTEGDVRTFALSTYPGAEDRALATQRGAATLHTGIIGGTGRGKSTLLARLALQDIEAGNGVVVVDLKNDLVPEIAARIPAHRWNDVIWLDPAVGGPQPGLTLFPAGGDSDLAVETLIATFEQSWGEAFGIRTAYYLRLGLKTLSHLPGATLLDLPRLFDPGYRNRVLGSISDPRLLSEWQRFAGYSAAEQAGHIAPLLTRLDQLLSRKHVRHVLGQSQSRLHFGEVLARGRIVLASLPLGLLGPVPTRLLTSCLLAQFLASVEARAALPPEKRTVFNAYLDEIAAVGATPLGLEGALERARAHGVGLTLAPQHLGQLSPSLKASLLANVGSLITFGLAADEAKAVARELPGVSPEQLQHLARFEVAMKLALGPGDVTRPMTGRTLPLDPPTVDPETLRRVSAERFGVTLEDVDASLHQRYGDTAGQPGDEGDAPIGARRRAS